MADLPWGAHTAATLPEAVEAEAAAAEARAEAAAESEAEAAAALTARSVAPSVAVGMVAAVTRLALVLGWC